MLNVMKHEKTSMAINNIATTLFTVFKDVPYLGSTVKPYILCPRLGAE